MTQYTPESLLQDARLQVEALGEGNGVLIVEGDTDKRSLVPRWAPVSNIVVGTDKSLVLGAHSLMRDDDRGRIICLVDCDDDVARGTLTGARDLIITTHADLEADLVAQGAIRGVVAQLVTNAVSSEQRLDEVTAAVLSRSHACAIPVGRLRRAARLAGIALEFAPWEFDYSQVRSTDADVVDEDAVRDEFQRRAGLRDNQMSRIDQHLPAIGQEYRVCNGKDVIAACAVVLRMDFRVQRRRLESLEDLVRMGLSQRGFDSWDVARRVRLWEDAGGNRVLSG